MRTHKKKGREVLGIGSLWSPGDLTLLGEMDSRQSFFWELPKPSSSPLFYESL